MLIPAPTPAASDPSPQVITSQINERFISVDGCQVRYLTGGAGPPLVLLPGLLGYSFSWRFNLASLSEVRTVYALDLPGTGYSGRPTGAQCDLRALARNVLRFMQCSGLHSADLLGSSHGGAVAMTAAAAAHEFGIQISSLILASPVNPWSSSGSFLTALLGSSPGARLFRPVAPRMAPLHNYFLRRMYGDPARIASGTLSGYSAPLAIPGTFDYLLACVRGWKRNLAELRSLLPRIPSLPVLLIWGTRDRAVAPSSAHHLLKEFRRAELFLIEGAGHLPYEEFPQEFNRAARGFLAKYPAAL
jgi:pimeloyl-ACP methyl ester carboxylesterase